jgi:hypothetical protein
MKTIILKVILLSFLTTFLISCDEDKTSFGSSCDANSNCEGVCNVGLPQGMCTQSCDDLNPCSDGVCVTFSATSSYCMPSCEDNTDCRENYSCIDFKCAPLQPLGAQCDDVYDCFSCTENENCPDGEQVSCVENVCSIRCIDQSQCVEGTVCAESENEFWCVGIYFQQGAGTSGEICPDGTCADGFTCLSGEGELDYCSNECLTSRDCPPDMVCRDDATGLKWCFQRNYCEFCDIDSQCGFEQDKCVTGDGTEYSRYCSQECEEGVDGSCPPDSTCKNAYFCDDSLSWVDDCVKCSGNCGTANPVFQCFNNYEQCIGNGGVCDPCLYDSQCDIDLACVVIAENQLNLCAETCDASSLCPVDFECVDYGVGSGERCVPVSKSCN